jgi:hypothetical protein
MTGFERFTEEQDAFRASKLFREKYDLFIRHIQANCRGLKNAKLDIGLCEFLDIKSPALRALVKFCRREGHPIGSTEEGYFWAESFADLTSTLAHLTERRDSLSYTISQMRKCYADECQGCLFDG